MVPPVSFYLRRQRYFTLHMVPSHMSHPKYADNAINLHLVPSFSFHLCRQRYILYSKTIHGPILSRPKYIRFITLHMVPSCPVLNT